MNFINRQEKSNMTPADTLKQEILDKVKEYYMVVHDLKDVFVPGKSRVNYAGRVFDAAEMCNLVDSSLDFWLTYGHYSKEFEKRLAEFLGIKYAFFVNSRFLRQSSGFHESDLSFA